MRVFVMVAALSGLAAAEPNPRQSIELDRERTPLLEGRLTLRLARGMIVDADGPRISTS